MTRIGNLRHPGDPGGQTRDKATDRHMSVNEIRLFRAQDGDQRRKGTQMRQWRQAPHEWDRDDTEPVGTNVIQQRTFRACANDLVTPVTHRTHQRQQEVP